MSCGENRSEPTYLWDKTQLGEMRKRLFDYTQGNFGNLFPEQIGPTPEQVAGRKTAAFGDIAEAARGARERTSAGAWQRGVGGSGIEEQALGDVEQGRIGAVGRASTGIELEVPKEQAAARAQAAAMMRELLGSSGMVSTGKTCSLG